MCDLEIDFLETDDRLLRAGRRGRDWTIESLSARDWKYRSLRTVKVSRGELEFFAIWGGLKLGGVRSLLLGGWESPAYWQALIEAKIRRVRTVGFYESTIHSRRHSSGIVSLARTWFFKQLDVVVVPGPAARDSLLTMGLEESRIVVGFNAIDVQSFYDAAVEARRSEQLDGQAPGHRFIYVGQFIQRKNVDGLLRAFNSVRNSGDSLTIVGSGALEEPMKSLADELSLTASVHFLPPVANAALARILSKSHTLVMPSHEEVWGLVANEGLAAGLHVVVTAQSGVAPSISKMRGVYVSKSSEDDDIAVSMDASRGSWYGWIEDPQVLEHTPGSYAMTFAKALLNEDATA